MKPYVFWLVLVAVVLGIIRFFVPFHPVSLHGSYEAIAHCFVGGLIGAWLAARKHWLLVPILALIAVELTAVICK